MTFKEELLRLIKINRPISRREARLEKDLIVSMTSYGHRLETCHLTIECILSQTILPNLIVLWLTPEDYIKIPDALRRLVSERVKIGTVSDLRSYKKLIPSLINFPDSFIVTVDDDLYFPPTWLEELISAHDFTSNNMTAHRAHVISRNRNGEILPYLLWKRTAGVKLDAHPDIFPTNGAGSLFPPGALHPDVKNAKEFLALAPTADDIWIYCMLRKAGNMSRSTGSANREFNWPGSQDSSLWAQNQRGENDLCVMRLQEYFRKSVT